MLCPVIVDEAHNYFGRGADVEGTNRALSENRTYRMPIYAATQYLDQFHPLIRKGFLSNGGTFVVLRCSAKDADVLQREMALFDRDDVLSLRVGEALVRTEGTTAFNVDIHNPPKPDVTFRDYIIESSQRRFCRPRKEIEAAFRRSYTSASGIAGEKATELTLEEAQVMDTAVNNPEMSLGRIQQLVGFGGYRFQRILGDLERRNLIRVVDTRLGKRGTRAKYAVPTKVGLQALGRKIPGRGGPVHKHFANLIAARGKSKGYLTVIEKSVEAGYVDVHLEREGECLAVEISVVANIERELNNVRKDVKAGYERVLLLMFEEDAVYEAREKAQEILSEEEFGRLTVSGIEGLDGLF